MKVIILNKKKIGVTLIIVGLMVILFVFAENFAGKVKYTALIQNNISSFKTYKALDNKLSYKLPEQWKTSVKNFGGDEIIYHNDFISEDSIIHGMVEVWNINKDLKEFLEESKQISDKQNTYKNYSIKPIKINEKDGYELDYTILTNGNNYYNGNEYFIMDKDKFFRFSFFVREQNFKENMPIVFKTIVETMDYREK